MNPFVLDPDFEPRIADWLEDDPDRAPDAVLETVLAAFPSIPQRRAVRVPWRYRPMSVFGRLAAAVIALAVVAVGGALVLQPRGPSVGTTPTPAPSTPAGTPGTSPTLSPSASALAFGIAPDETRGDWQAIAQSAIPFVYNANDRIQMSIDWQSGGQTWIQTIDGSQVLKADVLSGPADEIDLVASVGSESTGCDAGQVGRYHWSRTADGLFLTMTAIEEACANRQSALARTWVHSLSAVTDGKTGVFPFHDWVKMTLPNQRFGLSGDGMAYLHPVEGPDRSLLAIEDPMGFDAPCGANRRPISIKPTTADFLAYLGTMPGFTVTTANATVGGRPAVHVTLSPKGSATCLDGEIAAFHGNVPAGNDSEWKLTVGRPHSLWVLNLDGHTALFVYEGTAVTPAEETSVISSFEFLTDLPTP